MNKLISAVVAACVLAFGAVGLQAQTTDPATTTQTPDQKQTPKKHHHKGKHHKKVNKTTQETPAPAPADNTTK